MRVIAVLALTSVLAACATAPAQPVAMQNAVVTEPRKSTITPAQRAADTATRNDIDCTRQNPPRIGSTYTQVMATCWGRVHKRVNRTTTAAGTREQHVYPQSSPIATAAYLYYDKGILVAVQR